MKLIISDSIYALTSGTVSGMLLVCARCDMDDPQLQEET